jgi:hypothetical protein
VEALIARRAQFHDESQAFTAFVLHSVLPLFRLSIPTRNALALNLGTI